MAFAYHVTFLLVLVVLGPAHASDTAKSRNVMLFIGDGLGPAHVAFSIHYAEKIQNKTLAMQKLMAEGNTGYIVPWPFEKVVSDSGATATAMSTGESVRNETIHSNIFCD